MRALDITITTARLLLLVHGAPEINIRYPIYLVATIVAPLPADERVPADATPPAAYDGGIVDPFIS